MKRLGAALALSVLVGCSLPAPPGPPAPRGAPTQVAASFGRTWDAVIDELTDRNIPIKTLERSSGLIATERWKIRADIGDVADCGTDVVSFKLVPTDAAYNVLVRGDRARSTVRVNARWLRLDADHRRRSDDGAEECSTRGMWETAMEERIKAAAEAKP